MTSPSLLGDVPIVDEGRIIGSQLSTGCNVAMGAYVEV